MQKGSGLTKPLTPAAASLCSGSCTSAAIDARPPAPKDCDRHAAADLAHYVIVRADLPHGSQVAQTIHAAGESAVEPIPSGTIAVALAARDRAHLVEIADRLTAASIPHKVILECDGEPMAIGVRPTRDRATVRKVLSSIPLIR